MANGKLEGGSTSVPVTYSLPRLIAYLTYCHHHGGPIVVAASLVYRVPRYTINNQCLEFVRIIIQTVVYMDKEQLIGR